MTFLDGIQHLGGSLVQEEMEPTVFKGAFRLWFVVHSVGIRWEAYDTPLTTFRLIR